jgi:hypothetical protein
MNVHWPEMVGDQEQNTVFLKPLVASPKTEVAATVIPYYPSPKRRA